MNLLKEKAIEVIKSIMPLIAVICLLQFFLVKAPIPLFFQFLIGSIMAMIGLVLFFLGIDTGILPMGRFIGAEMPKKGSLWLIAAVSFLLGFASTIAEPDVLVLSAQVEKISGKAVSGDLVLYVMAIGVGIFVSFAMLRIVFGIPMTYLLASAYSVVIILSLFSPPEFIPLAYDAGSVTTGALTTPVVISLAIGLSSVLSKRSAIANGFGLLGISSTGPIIAIMVMGIVTK